ncbi:MAG: hypothetical protein ACREAM_31080 [Blastocatellia bacterium]
MSSALSACGNSSSVDSSSQSRPASVVPAPSNSASVAASPATSATVQGASTPAPTQNPALKQAQAQPGVPVPVPESMKRPLNSEEMKKAMEQLPPEVRARIMGMQKLPTPSPQPAKK